MSELEILLVYDEECPVCDLYCRAVRRGEHGASVRLINARDRSGALMQEVTRQAFDIDQGMVVKLEDKLYYGADAVYRLARRSRSSGAFGCMNRWLFGSQRRAQLLYPTLRSGRNLLLKALRKSKINNLQLPNNERF